MICPQCDKTMRGSVCEACGYALRAPKVEQRPKAYEQEPIDPVVLEKIHALLKRMKNPRDPKAWARRILERHAAGTYTFAYGIECASKALGLGTTREPGEEG